MALRQGWWWRGTRQQPPLSETTSGWVRDRIAADQHNQASCGLDLSSRSSLISDAQEANDPTCGRRGTRHKLDAELLRGLSLSRQEAPRAALTQLGSDQGLDYS